MFDACVRPYSCKQCNAFRTGNGFNSGIWDKWILCRISDDVEVKDTTNQKEESAGEPVKETEIEIKTPLAEPALTEKEPSPEQLAPSGQSEQAHK
jgi:hypothetical protein